MTDSEKLDLILAEVAEMKTDMKDLNQKADKLAADQADLKKRVGELAVEQTRMQGEMYKIGRKIDDTYGVALDALASTAENRKWLETGTKTLI